MKDLIILAADLDVLQGFLPRLERTGATHAFDFDIHRHPYRDPGCANASADFLRPFHQQYQKALVIFDREGSGQEQHSRERIEATVEKALAENGWAAENVAAVVLDPEIENWMWMDSPHVAAALNWRFDQKLYDWLQQEKWLPPNHSKPPRPKEAIETALRKTKTPRSASIYKEIAQRVSFLGCSDPAFLKLSAVLKDWFPVLQ